MYGLKSHRAREALYLSLQLVEIVNFVGRLKTSVPDRLGTRLSADSCKAVCLVYTELITLP